VWGEKARGRILADLAMDEQSALTKVRAALVAALEERLGLVAFSRLEALEMDQHARTVELEALDQVRALLPAAPAEAQLQQVRTRLTRMEEALQGLASRADIQERSRALERDDITWRAFEDISWLLGMR
jgi:hypothetical protein